MLNKSLDSQTRELNDLHQRNRALVASVGQFEAKLSESSMTSTNLRSQLDRMSQELSHLKKEKELWKASEARNDEDRAMVIQERDRLNELIRNLQTMHAEFERTENAAKRKLEDDKFVFEKEITVLRTAIQESNLEVKAITARKDQMISEWTDKFEQKNSEAQNSREALVRMEEKAKHFEARVEELKVELSTKQDEIRLILARARTVAPAPGSSTETSSEGTTELESQLSKAKQDLAEAKLEADRHRQHAETYMEISKSAEEKLASNNEIFTQYQVATQCQLDEITERNAELETKLQELEGSVARLETERDQIQNDSTQRITALQTELEQLQAVHQAAVNAENMVRLRFFYLI